ncbi:peptidoglycan recognition protein family protein [Myxococcota bacterium]|nr:peptidoglycan recognition protein family protein [Myxococcota bacterium]
MPVLPLLLVLSRPAAAIDPDLDGDILPRLHEPAEALLATWADTGAALRSPVRRWPTGGTRVGALVDGEAVEGRARGLAGGRAGPWVPLSLYWQGEENAVLVADLGRWYPAAQVELDQVPAGIAWELRVPVDEPRGPAVLRPPSVSAALSAIGVIPRETWGAEGTTCTSTEDDWYRFAIHHTAGNQTSSGTVQGAVQALQAYSMGSGEYCDIPYQFLVGYDGSLWEGRNLSYYSGATGGGNNDGNIAVSFLGCYTGSGCPGSSHEATDAMMAAARLLVQTLADEHVITTTDETLKGHRDWPGNSTVCPGDYIYARLDELMSEGAHLQGTLVDSTFPVGGVLEVELGQTVTGTVTFRNDGLWTWSPGSTSLATLPRDSASPLQAGDWLSSTRISTVPTSTAPGASVAFPVSVYGASLGSHSLSLALVQEWVSWFGDIPFGGGPADGSLVVQVEVVEAGEEPTDGGAADGGAADGGTPDGGGTDGGTAGQDGGAGDGGWGDGGEGPLAGAGPGGLTALDDTGGGCGCGGGGVAGGGLGLLGLLGLVRRRSRPAATTPPSPPAPPPPAAR